MNHHPLSSMRMKAFSPSPLKSYLTLCLMVAIWLCISSPAIAQCDLAPGQLVTNCDFDTDTSGWTANRGTLSHSAAIGENDLGAMGCTGEAGGAWTWCQPVQCIAVSPSTMYGTGFDVVLTTPPATPGSYAPSAEVRYQESTDATCTSLFGGNLVASGSGLSTTSSFQQSSGTLTTTGAANSVQLEIRVLNQGGNQPDDVFTAHYDDVFFGIGLVPVELQSFSIE